VLVLIGLIGAPLTVAYFMSQTFPPIFRDGTWEKVTTPGPAPYHPFWAPLLIGEIVVNLGIIALSIYLLYLFFRKSSRFPKTYILFAIVSFAFVLVDALAAQVVLPDQPLLDAHTARELGRSAIAAAIWIPYMIFSERVRNTFVRMDV
jgi:hypothetical protein